MGLVLTSLAAPHPRPATGARSSASSTPPRRLAAGFLAWLRRVSSRGSRVAALLAAVRGPRVFSVVIPEACTARGDGGPSMRDGLAALARVNAAVRADLLIADRCRSRGDLRPT